MIKCTAPFDTAFKHIKTTLQLIEHWRVRTEKKPERKRERKREKEKELTTSKQDLFTSIFIFADSLYIFSPLAPLSIRFQKFNNQFKNEAK